MSTDPTQTTYGWGSSYQPLCVYAPAVPAAERFPEHSWDHDRWRRHRERNSRRWRRTIAELGDRVLVVPDFDFTRPDIEYGRGSHREFSRLWQACVKAWESARPVAGAIDLGELDRQLAAELWTSSSILAQCWILKREDYDTKRAQAQILEQFDSRLSDLEALAEQHAALYRDSGSDATALPDVVRRALEQASALNEDRPVRDHTELVANLRDLVKRLADTDPVPTPDQP
ncbi:hypothetical protein [Kitasatospora sp. NPDC088548]|uniref:hypothetical protein n=1 Tax=Kitasatospora sp. NPDC088548 TaxID=3364075 RepID=UPI003812CD0C